MAGKSRNLVNVLTGAGEVAETEMAKRGAGRKAAGAWEDPFPASGLRRPAQIVGPICLSNHSPEALTIRMPWQYCA